jgi:hypothetical protein
VSVPRAIKLAIRSMYRGLKDTKRAQRKFNGRNAGGSTVTTKPAGGALRLLLTNALTIATVAAREYWKCARSRRRADVRPHGHKPLS